MSAIILKHFIAFTSLVGPVALCAANEPLARYIVEKHHVPPNIEAQYSSILPGSSPPLVHYEFCNLARNSLVFNWVGIAGVSQGRPLVSYQCLLTEMSAPLGVEIGDTTVRYLHDELNAVVHLPVENKPAGISEIFTDLYSRWGRGTRAPKDPSATKLEPMQKFAVTTRVTNKGDGLQYTVTWTQKISPLAIQYITEEESVRRELASRILRQANGRDATLEFSSIEEFQKKFGSVAFDRLPEAAKVKGSTYIFITPKDNEGEVNFMLPAGENLRTLTYQMVLLTDGKGHVGEYWMYPTLTAAPEKPPTPRRSISSGDVKSRNSTKR